MRFVAPETISGVSTVVVVPVDVCVGVVAAAVFVVAADVAGVVPEEVWA
jgi:hypothetical protein